MDISLDQPECCIDVCNAMAHSPLRPILFTNSKLGGIPVHVVQACTPAFHGSNCKRTHGCLLDSNKNRAKGELSSSWIHRGTLCVSTDGPTPNPSHSFFGKPFMVAYDVQYASADQQQPHGCVHAAWDEHSDWGANLLTGVFGGRLSNLKALPADDLYEFVLVAPNPAGVRHNFLYPTHAMKVLKLSAYRVVDAVGQHSSVNSSMYVLACVLYL